MSIHQSAVVAETQYSNWDCQCAYESFAPSHRIVDVDLFRSPRGIIRELHHSDQLPVKWIHRSINKFMIRRHPIFCSRLFDAQHVLLLCPTNDTRKWHTALYWKKGVFCSLCHLSFSLNVIMHFALENNQVMKTSHCYLLSWISGEMRLDQLTSYEAPRLSVGILFLFVGCQMSRFFFRQYQSHHLFYCYEKSGMSSRG